MNKQLCPVWAALAVVFCIGILASCAPRPKSDREKRDQQFERVLSAIQNEDINYLESLFSKKALLEAKDFDSGVRRLLTFFNCDVISYEFEAEGIDDKKIVGYESQKNDGGIRLAPALENIFSFSWNIPEMKKILIT